METGAIIFDLGGVLLNIDYGLTSAAFRALGMEDFDERYSQARQAGLFDQYEKGAISSDEFRARLLELLPSGTTPEQVDQAWCAMLLDFPPSRLRLLEDLRKRYRIFLLSNTNEIHMRALSAYLQRQFGFSDFSKLFVKEYYSYRMGMRKPDAEIFETVLRENDLRVSEVVFIDDSKQHVEGALKLGIDARLLEKGVDIGDARGPLKEFL